MRDLEFSKGWVNFVLTLKVETKGGIQKMACSDTKELLRIIQSIPSPKAEPFKLLRKLNNVYLRMNFYDVALCLKKTTQSSLIFKQKPQ